MRVRRPDGPTIIGIALVLLGALWLAARFINIDLSRIPWPFYIVVPGVVIFLFSLAARDRGGEGLAIAGGVVTMVGLISLYQDLTGHWESWAYAWALVAPGGVGLGLLLFGLLAGRLRLAVNGGRALLAGLGLFLAGAVFFELILNIGGDHFGQTGRIALSAVLVVSGLLWLTLSLRPLRR